MQKSRCLWLLVPSLYSGCILNGQGEDPGFNEESGPELGVAEPESVWGVHPPATDGVNDEMGQATAGTSGHSQVGSGSASAGSGATTAGGTMTNPPDEVSGASEPSPPEPEMLASPDAPDGSVANQASTFQSDLDGSVPPDAGASTNPHASDSD